MKVDVSNFLFTYEELGVMGEDIPYGNPKWEEAKHKVLIFFPGALKDKFVSSTVQVLYESVRQTSDKVYIDVAYQFPTQIENKLRKRNLPTHFSLFQNRTFDEFDIILISTSIHYELAYIFRLFFDSYNKIKPFHQDRISDPSQPFIFAGGVIASLLEPWHGFKKGSLVDLVYVGEADNRLIEVLKDLYSLPYKKDKLGTIEYLVKKYNFLYYPSGYDIKVSPTDPLVLDSITKKYNWLPDKVYFCRTTDVNNLPSLFENKFIFYPDVSLSSADIRISYGCSGSGLCRFCHEANERGPYFEVDKDIVLERVRKAKKLFAPSNITLFAFNVNYYSDYMGLLESLAKEIPRFSLLAFRGDVAASHPEIYYVLKELGVNKSSIGLEGISNRIRNGLLNKNLTEEQILTVAEVLASLRFGTYRFLSIETGYEEPEDLQEWDNLIAKIVRLRNSFDANLGISFGFVPLIHYPHTPLFWAPRRSFVNFLNNDSSIRAYTTVLKEKYTGLQFSFVSRPKAAYQQTLIDFHRACSEEFLISAKEAYDNYDDLSTTNFSSRYLRRCWLKFGFIDSLDSTDLSKVYDFVLKEREVNDNHPYSVLETSSSSLTKKMAKELWKPLKYCLRSLANQNSKCNACGICPPDNVKKMTQRPIEQSSSLQKIKTVLINRSPRSFLRVVYRVHNEFFAKFRWKGYFDHKLGGAILSFSDELFNSYVTVTDLLLPSFCGKELPSNWCGFHFFDMHFSTESPKSYLKDFSPSVIGIDLYNYYEIPKSALDLKPTGVFGFKSDRYGIYDILTAYKDWDGSVSYSTSNRYGSQQHSRVTKFKELSAKFEDGKTKFTLSFSLLNPFLVLKGMGLGKAISNVIEAFDVECLDYVISGSSTCKVCGATSVYSLVHNRELPFCLEHLNSFYLRRL